MTIMTVFAVRGYSQIGCMTAGDYFQTPIGILDIELGADSPPCTGYDQLQVTDTLSADGTLNVTLFGGYLPAPNTVGGITYTIATAGTRLGTFSTVNYPALPAGLIWSIQYNATSITVNVYNPCNPDVTPPMATVPADATLGTNPSTQCSAPYIIGTPTAVSDNCSMVTTTANLNGFPIGIGSFVSLPKGLNYIAYKFTDASSNMFKDTTYVLVIDDDPPTINCPPNVVVLSSMGDDNIAGDCSATVIWNAPVVSDNCPGVSSNQTTLPLIGTSFPVGVHTVTYVATDLASNTSSCSFLVTVMDDEPPTNIVCPTPANPYFNDTNLCSATLSFSATAMDNCAASLIYTYKIGMTTIVHPYAYPVGTSVVTATASDGFSSISCMFTVIVQDTTAPVWITTPNSLNASVLCSNAGGLAAAQLLAPSASDNCGVISSVTKFSGSFVAGMTCPQAGTYTNKWIAVDPAGNVSDTFYQVITIFDNVAPTWTTLAGALNRTVNCTNISGLIAAQALFPVASDNCDASVTNIVKISGPFVGGGLCAQEGTYTNTWTVTDDCGNVSAVYTQVITIEDNNSPVLSTPASNMTVQCDGFGNAAAYAAWLANHAGAMAADSCGSITWSTNCGAGSGNALNFDGVNDYVNIGNVAPLNFERTNTFSIEAWVKYTGTFEEKIFSKMQDTPPYAGYEFYAVAGGNVRVYLISNFGPNYIQVGTTSTPLADGQWHHVAMSYDGTSNASGVLIYVDGVLQPTTILSNTLTTSILTATPAVIGARNGSAFFWPNSIDELRVWNVARTGPQILANMNSELNAQAGLVAAYHFNHGIAGGANPGVVTAVDASASAINGTLNNFALNGPTSNWVLGQPISNPCAFTDLCAATGASTVTFIASDACGNTTSTVATFTIEDTTPPTANPLPAINVECFSDITPQNIADVTGESDVCGGSVTVTYLSDAITSVMCDGDSISFLRKYQITDQCGNTAVLNQTINVNAVTPPLQVGGPVSTTSNIECVASAVPPTLPVVVDVCGLTLPAPVPVITATGDTTCNGSKIYTYTYTDCTGLSYVWTYTYVITRVTAPTQMGGPVSTASTVECVEDATAPALPMVKDICLNTLSAPVPVITATGDTTCEGSKIYTYTYADCAGLTYNWVYTYTIDRVTPPAIPSNLGPNVLVGTSAFQDSMWVYNPNTFQITARIGPTLSGFTITGLTSITRHPSSYTFYAIAKVSSGPRRLVTINVSTGVCTDIGPLGNNFSSITFAPNGVLFGAVGDGGANPESLWKINPTTAAVTFVKTMGNGADGEVIAFNPDNGLLHHWSGNITVVYETTDTTAIYAPTIIGRSGPNASTGEVFGAVYIGNDSFIVSNINSRFYYQTSTGVTSANLSSNPDDLRGLGYYNQNGPSITIDTTVECVADAVPPPSPVVTDVCGNVLLPSDTLITDTPALLTCEGERVYVYTYTDCSGLSSTWTFTYTIDDTQSPVPVCPAGNVTVTLDGTGNYNLTQAEKDALGTGSTDNCLGTLAYSINGAFTCANSGTIDGVNNLVTRTLTVTDCAGNDSTCQVTFRILPINPLADNGVKTICSDVPFIITLQDSIDNGIISTFSWTVVYDAGLTGGDYAGVQSSGTINETSGLTNVTDLPHNAVYTISTFNAASGCAGSVFTITVTVNPEPVVANQVVGPICSDITFGVNYNGDAGLGALTYTLNSITNSSGLTPGPNNETAGETGLVAADLFDDSWTNTTSGDATIIYNVTPISPLGCEGNPFTVTITIRPEPVVADLATVACSRTNIGAGSTLPTSGINTGELLTDGQV